MSTLYAFINQDHYKNWSNSSEEPCVEQFLRQVGTVKIQFSKDRLDQSYVPVKPGGCVRLVSSYPQPPSQTVQIVKKPAEPITQRFRRWFGFGN